jgi:RNA polymerase sigma-70 factor (ECF subfamily)
MMDKPDKWLRGLRAGERDALEWLAKEFHVKVLRFLVGLTGDLELAEDLAQETAIQIWAKVVGCRFANLRALSAWVYKVALNVYRQHKRQHRVETVPLDDDIAQSSDDDPEREIERLETIAHVRWAVSQLPEAEKQALVLKAFQSLSYREIADVTGEPVGTVKWRVSRAYERLREILECESMALGLRVEG